MDLNSIAEHLAPSAVVIQILRDSGWQYFATEVLPLLLPYNPKDK